MSITSKPKTIYFILTYCTEISDTVVEIAYIPCCVCTRGKRMWYIFIRKGKSESTNTTEAIDSLFLISGTRIVLVFCVFPSLRESHSRKGLIYGSYTYFF
jgi:hypothetical protein